VSTLRGIDVSYAQPNLNWSQAAQEGVQFGICKRSEGTSGLDVQFDHHWTAIKDAGLPRGAYHFSRWDLDTDPAAEAQWFLTHVPLLDQSDVLVLDIEDSPNGVPGRDLSSWALTWLAAVEKATERAPIVYSGAYFASRSLTDARLARYGLWVAAYGPQCPGQVGPWPFPAFWQHTSSAYYAGQRVDEDYFFGSLDQLHAYGKPSAPVPAPPSPHGTGAKFLVLRDMMARAAPDLDAVRQPIQMVYKGAVLNGTGKQTPHWAECIAGGHAVWLFLPNLQPVPAKAKLRT
jgi:lysozyme